MPGCGFSGLKSSRAAKNKAFSGKDQHGSKLQGPKRPFTAGAKENHAGPSGIPCPGGQRLDRATKEGGKRRKDSR